MSRPGKFSYYFSWSGFLHATGRRSVGATQAHTACTRYSLAAPDRQPRHCPRPTWFRALASGVRRRSCQTHRVAQDQRATRQRGAAHAAPPAAHHEQDRAAVGLSWAIPNKRHRQAVLMALDHVGLNRYLGCRAGQEGKTHKGQNTEHCQSGLERRTHRGCPRKAHKNYRVEVPVADDERERIPPNGDCRGCCRIKSPARTTRTARAWG